mmetsp:Transcript_17495/g.28305  ORF Transcript_17495/g.28305 Transcript_17495/m.28305 type:complete len:396 (-) Transcript_17495:1519-2706(-)
MRLAIASLCLQSVAAASWNTVDGNPDVAGRAGFSGGVFDGGSKVLVWGGRFDSSTSQPNDFMDLRDSVYILDEQFQWSTAVLNGSDFFPIGRTGHSLIGPMLVNETETFILFGGMEATSRHYPTESNPDQMIGLTRTDIGWKWETLAIGNVPSQRQGHGMTSVPTQNAIYLFGGYKYDKNTANVFKDDLYHVHFAPNTESTWTSPFSARETISNERPSHRKDHTFLAFDSCVVLFGGVRYNFARASAKQGDVEFLDETWILEAPDAEQLAQGRQLAWKAPFLESPSAVRPAARGGHAVARHGTKMIMYGGYAILSSDERHIRFFDDVWVFETLNGAYTWTKLSPTGTVPSPRSWNFGALMNSATFVSIGGSVLLDTGEDGEKLTIIEPEIHWLQL